MKMTNGKFGEEKEQVRTLYPQWRTVFAIAVLAIAVLTICVLDNKQQMERAGVVIATTAILWCTEAMPLMITALVPTILFPFAGVMDTKDVSKQYYNYISMLMLGTFFMAESVESCGLHRRIALGILSLLGKSEALLMLGSMLVTWKLSMFMSNTATTAMMLPIIAAIMQSLRIIQRSLDKKNGIQMSEIGENPAATDKPLNLKDLEEGIEDEEIDEDADISQYDSPEFRWFCKGLMLSIPYGASIGGIATLTGTPPNLVFKAAFELTFPNGPTVDYGKWLAFCYPISLLTVLCGWHVLVLMYARVSYFEMVKSIAFFCMRKESVESENSKKWKRVNVEIRKKYRALGPMRFPEYVLVILTVILVLLWLLREPAGFDGWALAHLNAMVENPDPAHLYLKDAWVVIVMGCVLFLIPTENPLQGTFLWKAPPGHKFARSKKLLEMDKVMSKTPWDVFFLLGGGYAIAEGCQKSGLSKWLGDSFIFLKGQNDVLIILVICILVACLTEVASNTASTTILMPILASMAETLDVSPLYLMCAGTIAASLAFCLPSATAPNALVFSFKEIKAIDMLRTGVVMNLCSVLIVVFGVSTWTLSILGIGENVYNPDWKGT